MRNGRITGLYVVTRLVIAVLVLFFLTVIARVFTRQILEEALGMNNNFTRIVFFDKPGFEKAFAVKEINWEKEYPFSERKTTKTNPEIGISKTDIFERIRSLANTIENKVI
ncbi:MAG: hypothetical protein GX768_11030, partial [Chloroflexi bacterium]|nr:hypothetical protein [Chloroflexota bacterium]